MFSLPPRSFCVTRYRLHVDQLLHESPQSILELRCLLRRLEVRADGEGVDGGGALALVFVLRVLKQSEALLLSLDLVLQSTDVGIVAPLLLVQEGGEEIRLTVQKRHHAVRCLQILPGLHLMLELRNLLDRRYRLSQRFHHQAAREFGMG